MSEVRADNSDDTDMAARTGDTYTRLRELFAIVSELDEGARAAWMSEHIPDAEERAALKTLLDADRSEGGYLDVPADEHAARMMVNESLHTDGLIGQRIGVFRLTRLLGKGGMAAVFLGEREDGDFQQRVAIKLLRRGLYSEIEQRLFRRERQLLAGLEHPNIAHLVDGGVTTAGIPYLVIEYVDGSPITQHACEHALGIRQRLELFLVVCRAVEAAHRALIVHRDIKPSNILVATDGTVKLLDFGIAKLLEDDAENPTVGVFTPDYAAPEQLSGAPVTTATDVYALGVLLHELLLGLKPRGKRTRRPSSLAGGLREDAITMKPLQLARALRGDLDTILLKCLAEEPAQRYASAGALADDIRRHLDGKPVEAHPPSRWYRTRKFVQRHRGSVAVSAALLAAIFAALGIALWQADVARREAARAREVQGFVESLFQPLQEGTGPSKMPSVMELLQRGLARVDNGFHEDRRAQADLLAMFARIDNSIGEVRKNRELSERAWHLNADVYGANDLRTLRARELHARVLGDLDEETQALSELNAVRAAMDSAGVHGNAYAQLLDDLSSLRMDQNAGDAEIIAMRQQALAERQRDPGATPEDLTAGYNNLGIAYDRASQWQPAIEWYRQAYESDRVTKGDSLDTAIDLGNVGNIQYWMGQWRESVATLTAAREIYRRVAINNHPNLISLLTRLCDEQAQLELDDDGEATCGAAVDLSARVFGEKHPSYAMALLRRAGARSAQGRFVDADADLTHANTIYATAEGKFVGPMRIASVTQAAMDYARGDYPALRERLRPILSTPHSPSAPRTFAWFALACLHSPGDGCRDDSEKIATQILDDSTFTQHPNQLPGHVALAQIALARGDAKSAIDGIEKALAITSTEIDTTHSWTGDAHRVLGDARAALGDTAAAKSEYKKAVAILQKLPADNPQRVLAESRLNMSH